MYSSGVSNLGRNRVGAAARGVANGQSSTSHYPSAATYGRVGGVGAASANLSGGTFPSRRVVEEKKSGVRERSSLGSTAYRNSATRPTQNIGATPSGMTKNVSASQNGIQTPVGSTTAGGKSYAGSTSSYQKGGYGSQYDANNSNILANSMKPTTTKTLLGGEGHQSNYGAFGMSKAGSRDIRTNGTATAVKPTATIKMSTHQRLGFGDNYGNERKFAKPDEEQKTRDIENVEPAPVMKMGQKGISMFEKSDKMDEKAFDGSGGKYGYRPVGLSNIGNTCFMNSILQCVFATAPLTQWFIENFPKTSAIRKQRIAESYASLLDEARRANGSAIVPRALKDQISKVAPQFLGYGQQDAQEFLRFLLDGIHNELNRVTTKPPYKEINCDKLPVDKQSEEWASYFKARDNSIITDLFEGQLCSRLECTSCGYKSYTFDSFLDLSVGIPRKSVRITGYVGLEECLNSFIQPERMAECGYKCPKCKGIDKMEKEMTIFRLPKVLVIHLKRFYNSTMRREKLSTTVNLPAQLDMRPFAPRSKHPSIGKGASYKLYGISHHSGSLYGGHYIGEVLNLDDGQWYNCNDSRCSKSYSGAESSSASAYVLFYVQA